MVMIHVACACRQGDGPCQLTCSKPERGRGEEKREEILIRDQKLMYYAGAGILHCIVFIDLQINN